MKYLLLPGVYKHIEQVIPHVPKGYNEDWIAFPQMGMRGYYVTLAHKCPKNAKVSQFDWAWVDCDVRKSNHLLCNLGCVVSAPTELIEYLTFIRRLCY